VIDAHTQSERKPSAAQHVANGTACPFRVALHDQTVLCERNLPPGSSSWFEQKRGWRMYTRQVSKRSTSVMLRHNEGQQVSRRNDDGMLILVVSGNPISRW